MATTTYRITVKERLSDRFVAGIEGLQAEPVACGTALVGDVVDQTQLYGLLNRLRDLGVELIRVERVSG